MTGLWRDLTVAQGDPIAPFRETGLGENFQAARRAALYANTQIGSTVAMGDAMAERDRAIADAMGAPIGDVWARFQKDVPLFDAPVTGQVNALDLWQRRGQAEADGDRSGSMADVVRREKIYDAIRAALPQEARAKIPTLDQVRERAAEIARSKELTNADISSRSTGLGVVGQFAGGMAGTLQDPVNFTSLFLGVQGKYSILRTALHEGLIGAGVEAIQQPGIQAYRERIGLDAGLQQALENIGFAAGGGAVFGGIMRAGGKVLESLAGTPDEATVKRLIEARQANPTIRGAEQDIQTVAEIQGDNPGLAPDLHRGQVDRAIAAAMRGDAPVAPDTPQAELGRMTGAEGRRIVVQADPSARSLPGYEVDELQVDARRFQFKSGGDENGVVETLKGVTQWDDIRAGTAIFYEFADGQRFVADGHQRMGLARRLKAQNPDQEIILYGHTLREVDGITPEDAMMIGALRNLAETDTREDLLLDAGKALRIAPETLLSVLPPRSNLVKGARGLANLDEAGWHMALNGVVDPSYAAVVGRLIPTDRDRQQAALTVLARVSPENQRQAEAIVRDVLAVPVEKVQELSLFGEQEFATSLYLERAGVLDRVIKQLKKDRAVFGTLSREASRIEAQGNALNQDANVRRAEIDAQAIQTLQTLANRRGPLSDALNAAASRVRQDGGYSGAVRDFASAVRDAVERGDFEGLSIGGSGRAGDAAADRSGGAGPQDAIEGGRQDPARRQDPAQQGPAGADHAREQEFDTPGGPGQQRQSAALARDIQDHDPAWPETLPGQIVWFVRQVQDLGSGSKRGRKQAFIRIGRVDQARAVEIQRVLKEQGQAVEAVRFEGVTFNLSEDEAWKILRDHGGQAEVARGQVPLTPEDFAVLPDVLRYGDIRMPLKTGGSADRSDIVQFELQRAGDVTVIVRADIGQVQRRGGARLRVLSMWKRKGKGTDPDGADLSVRMVTPQPDRQTPEANPQRIDPQGDDIAQEGAEINRQEVPQEVPLAEMLDEDGNPVVVARTLADMEADHAADQEFLDGLKLCGRDAS